MMVYLNFSMIFQMFHVISTQKDLILPKGQGFYETKKKTAKYIPR
jgi:hypothetical protein